MKCPECGKEIEHLDVVREVTRKGVIYESGNERMKNFEVYDERYKCPECSYVIYDEEADVKSDFL